MRAVRLPAARHIRGQGHRAGVLNVFVMLPRKMALTTRPPTSVAERSTCALPAILPFGIREEAVHHFGIQVAFALEVLVEAAVRQASTLRMISAMGTSSNPRRLNERRALSVIFVFASLRWVGGYAA